MQYCISYIDVVAGGRVVLLPTLPDVDVQRDEWEDDCTSIGGSKDDGGAGHSRVDETATSPEIFSSW